MSKEISGGDLHDLTDLDGVGSGKAESLREAGFESVADVREASADELTRADGVGDALAATINESAAEVGVGRADADEDSVRADGGEAAAESEDEAEADEESDGEDADEADIEADEELEIETETDEPDAEDTDTEVAAEDLDMLEVRDAVRDVAETLIDDPLDGIIEIEQDEDRWYAVVEVIERSSVPDTQDILGRYEIDLDAEGAVVGYRLTDRYRRGDVSNSE